MSGTTRYIPEGGFSRSSILTNSFHTSIAAPAAHAFHLVTNPSTWPKWNTFCPSSSVETVSAGTRMTMQIRMDPLKPKSLSPLKVHVVSAEENPTGFKVCWETDGPWPAFLLTATRTQEFVVVDATHCEYRTIEFMDGWLAYVVKYLYPTATTLQARFLDWCDDLREYAQVTWDERVSN